MALPHISKSRMFWSRVATFWIPMTKYRRAIRGMIWMGVGNYFRVLRNDKTTHFPHELSVVAIIKDEGPYLKEWLDYHMLVGVEKFYIYDNESSDNTKQVLAPYIRRGIVEYTYLPGERQQNIAYIDAINRFSNDTRWLAIIDLDEFIVPVHNKTITEFLYTLPRNFGALVISWVIYGSAGHIKKPRGLVTANYKYHAARNWGVKSIVNPRLVVRQYNPHLNPVAGFIIDENGHRLGHIKQTTNPPSFNHIRCNHYVTKSFDEYRARCAKGSASVGKNHERKRWSIEKFNKYNQNDIYDDIMDKYIPLLKKSRRK